MIKIEIDGNPLKKIGIKNSKINQKNNQTFLFE